MKFLFALMMTSLCLQADASIQKAPSAYAEKERFLPDSTIAKKKKKKKNKESAPPKEKKPCGCGR